MSHKGSSPFEVGREPFNQAPRRELESLCGLLSVGYITPTRYLARWSWLAMGQYTARTPCSPHLLTVMSCDGARVQAEARLWALGTYAEARVGRLQLQSPERQVNSAD